MDLAELTLKANTASLEKAVLKIEKLENAVKGISPAVNKLSKVMQQTATVFSASIAAMSKSMYVLVSATKGATQEQIKAARGASQFAQNVYNSAKAQSKLATTTDQTTRAIERQVKTVTKLQTAAVPAVVAPARPTGNMSQTTKQISRFNTGNIAAQFQDIGVTAAMGMNPMTIALQQGTQLAAVINMMESPLKGIGAAFRSILNPVSLLSIGLTALVVVGIQAVDWVTAFTPFVNRLANAIDYLAPAFLGAAQALSIFFAAMLVSQIPAMVAGLYSVAKAAWAVASAFVLANPMTMVAGFLAFTGFIVGWAARSFGPIRDFVNKTTASFIFLKDIMIAPFSKEMSIDKALNKLREGMSGNIDYVGKFETSVKGLTDKMRNFGKTTDETTEKLKKQKDLFKEIENDALKRIAGYQLETQSIGMQAEAASYLKYEMELLNRAKEQDLKLAPEQEQRLKDLAKQMARSESILEKTRNSFNFAKSAGQSFFQDMKNGLVEGANAWQTFGNAVFNVLNKIFDRILESGVDLLFTGLQGGGFLSSSQKLAAAPDSTATGFAKGGAFTNRLFNAPTPFAFAGGGKFGVMGEAGPEAVVPLQRGPDGSLGVANYGGGGGNVVVNVNNNSSAQANVSQRRVAGGVEIDVLIDEAVGKKIAQQGTATNYALNNYNSRQLIRR